ncbi:MAG: response regulator [Pseudomonadales bacterium]|nr:response regulator [Pseudomonadales bacterium]
MAFNSALPAEHQLFISLFDAMPFPVYVADMHTYELIFVNQRYKADWQSQPSAKCYELIYQESSPCAHCNMQALCASEPADSAPQQVAMNFKPLVYEHFNPVDDHWYQMQDKAIFWPDGRLAKYSIAVDISDLKNMQNQLAETHAQVILKTKALKDAALTNLLKNDFMTALSHELRTPLNAITGGLDLLTFSDKKPNQAVQQAIPVIKSGSDRLGELVDDVLNFSEMQAGQVYMQNKACDITQLFLALKQKYQSLCKVKGLSLSWQQDLRPDSIYVIDGDKLKMILEKLLDNAVKFTPSGPISCTIKIDENNQLEVDISDSGCGISKQDESSIFKPFFQKESGFQRSHEGLGVGLFLCQQWVNILQGRLWLDSLTDGGSVFHLLMPLQPGQAQNNVTEKIPNKSILIVEDNPVNQQIMQRFLGALNLPFYTASNGEEALSLLHEESVGLILMDLQMPVMDGFSCTENIRRVPSEYQSIPIVAVTANVLSADKIRCDDVGMNDFLAKPISLSELKDMLSKYFCLDSV